jgi:hypothetical protein
MKSLEGLATGTMVNIIAYNDDLQPYSENLVELTDVTRRALIGWTRTLNAYGRTNIYDALAVVLNKCVQHGGRGAKGAMLVDSILLLSDGLPTEGRILDPFVLAQRIEQVNQLARVAIHTVGVGHDHSKALLEALSLASGGRYLRAK